MSNRVTVNDFYCKSCGLCVHICPKKIMEIDSSKMNAHGYNPAVCAKPEECIACGMCAVMCPDSAITVEKEEE